MHVMNNGRLMHTPMGMLKSGLNSVDDKLWAEMKKAPKVADALKGKKPRLKECEAPKAGKPAAQKMEPSPEAKAKEAQTAEGAK